MEFQKITNFLEINSDNKDLPKFVTKKWIMINHKEIITQTKIRIKTSMLRSDLCDYSDEYIVVKAIITVTEQDNAKK